MRDQVSHPYKTTVKIIVLNSLMFTFLGHKQEYKMFEFHCITQTKVTHLYLNHYSDSRMSTAMCTWQHRTGSIKQIPCYGFYTWWDTWVKHLNNLAMMVLRWKQYVPLMFVSTYKFTWCYCPGDQQQHHCCQNFISNVNNLLRISKTFQRKHTSLQVQYK
jgi:hypothetical protein